MAKADLEGAKCGHYRETIDIINHPTSSPSSKPLENQRSVPRACVNVPTMDTINSQEYKKRIQSIP
jgi:hypothetical protein